MRYNRVVIGEQKLYWRRISREEMETRVAAKRNVPPGGCLKIVRAAQKYAPDVIEVFIPRNQGGKNMLSPIYVAAAREGIRVRARSIGGKLFVWLNDPLRQAKQDRNALARGKLIAWALEDGWTLDRWGHLRKQVGEDKCRLKLGRASVRHEVLTPHGWIRHRSQSLAKFSVPRKES